MTKEEYKLKVIEYLKEKYPDKVVEDQEGDDQILVNGSITYLNTPYRASQLANFVDWEETLEDFLGSLSEIDLETKLVWEEIKDKVFPQIKRIDQLAYFEEKAEGAMEHIKEKFLDDLIMAFAIDFPNSFRYMTANMLEEMGINREEVKKQAMKNLGGKMKKLEELKVYENEEVGKFLSWETRDGYDAARIFLPDFYEIMAQELGEKFLVIIPERDCLMAGGMEVAKDLDRAAKEMFGGSTHPIWPDLIEVSPDGFALYKGEVKRDFND